MKVPNGPIVEVGKYLVGGRQVTRQVARSVRVRGRTGTVVSTYGWRMDVLEDLLEATFELLFHNFIDGS